MGRGQRPETPDEPNTVDQKKIADERGDEKKKNEGISEESPYHTS